jgi:hypothetical protein
LQLYPLFDEQGKFNAAIERLIQPGENQSHNGRRDRYNR